MDYGKCMVMSIIFKFTKFAKCCQSNIIFQVADGSDSIAVQLASEAHWDDLVVIIAVVCGCVMWYMT